MAPYRLQPESVRSLFDRIAPTYDLLNRLLSLRRDVYWRRMAVREFSGQQGHFLDIATGTGDVAIELIRQGIQGRKVVGLDFSEPMIRRAREKLLKKGLLQSVHLGLGDALFLPFPNQLFSGLVIAFGLRNIPKKREALVEMVRVLKPGGKIVILEFTLPERGWMKRLYLVYFTKILPRIGGWVSGDPEAYAYLPESVLRFQSAEEYRALLKESGLAEVSIRSLTGGIVSIISGIKNAR
ncbi:MAG: bifunctional demethylmenaquinone methyltransferase/2-methoxy-6-polyprenyl-1,4-benzoquinol methylase UbiE [Desulfobacterota bacterium]|nr:bifunctional demethylmenaquinone methyltransferase/2-methoxy-6-polyprenyl-1,4-benzoquinol methylase UbiE [Thermodesulfobacteriota bacterium]